MKVFSKIFVTGVSLFILAGCSTPLVKYNVDQEVLSLKINDKKRKEINLVNPTYNSGGGVCMQEYFRVGASTPEYGYIFTEHTAIKSNCEWHGLPKGYFVQSVQRHSKAKDVTLLSKKKIGQYEFYKYSLDGLKEFNIVVLWGANQSTIILDERGVLSQEIQEELSANL